MDFFEKNGLPLVTESRNRVFPKSQKAVDVFNLLEKLMEKYKVEIQNNQQVVKINLAGDNTKKVVSVKTKKVLSTFAFNKF